ARVALVVGVGALALVLLVGSGATTPLERVPLVDRLIAPDQDPLNSRGVAWSAAIAIWQESPIGGSGFRTGPAALDEARLAGSVDGFEHGAVHNGYLQTLVEIGVVGGILLGWALVPVLQSVRR